MRLGYFAVLASASAFLTLVACSETECDPGQLNTGEFCADLPKMMTEPEPTGGGAPGVGGAPDGAAGDGAAGDGAAGGGAMDPFPFLAPCADTSECEAPTDWCAIEPPATTGFCTRQGCLDDPTICPEAWGCTDLSVFSPSLPAICTPPMM